MGITVLALALTGVSAANAAPPSEPDFGPNVRIFDPSMSTAEIQAVVDDIADQQVENEMGEPRYSLLFKPGTYGIPEAPLLFQVGFYTEVAGLGLLPTDVQINVMSGEGCRSSANFWAASQAETNTAGTTGEDGTQAGRSIALSKFFVASPSDSVRTIIAGLTIDAGSRNANTGTPSYLTSFN